MAKVAVIGGGVSGLSAAYYLSKASSTKCSRILLLESTDRLGGWIQSSRFDDGAVYEHGPRSLRGVGKSGLNTLLLLEDLGLGNEIIPVPRSSPAAKNRFIYANGQLCPLPNGPGGLFRKMPPFSKSLISQAWTEPFKSAPKLEDDTIYNFFSRRFGEEIAKYAADPLCRGVFAGDAKKLSIRACMTQLFTYEQEYGSVIKGAIRAPRSKNQIQSPLVDRYKKEKWALWSFKRGLLQVTESLEQNLSSDNRVEIKQNTPCQGLEFAGDKVTLSYNGKREEFDYVISAVTSSGLSSLMEKQHPLVCQPLRSIPTVNVGVVNIEYEDAQLPYEGFGHLVPSCEKSNVLGVLYESSIFPEHNNKDKNTIKLTCMMGGSWFEELFGDVDKCDPSYLSETAVKAIHEQLKIKKEPYRVVCRLQKHCIPQYIVGHSKRVEEVFSYIQDNHLPISLIGASFQGVSINDCIFNARTETEKVLDSLPA